ncbi:MAG: hypothetical protein KZQ77_16940 [Candidatus Thiodiazotropha sp. (ex Notomyrtea botanica)]|nr:hypothetical protein [Candidatus Thiodiazotropha sp. (ex Notomyrtea botanica)]
MALHQLWRFVYFRGDDYFLVAYPYWATLDLDWRTNHHASFNAGEAEDTAHLSTLPGTTQQPEQVA